jgi:hypothetical protein
MIDATVYAIPVFVVSMLVEAWVLWRRDSPY